MASLSHAPTIRRETLSSDTEAVVSVRGTTYITRLAPGVMLITTVGYDDGTTAPYYFAAIDDELARTGTGYVFIDSRQQTGVAPHARDACAAWVQKNGHRLRGNHLLFRSKLLEMAVAVVNLMTRGPTKAHSSVLTFERLIREVVPGFRSLPTFPSR